MMMMMTFGSGWGEEEELSPFSSVYQVRRPVYIYIYPFHLDRSAENRVELNLKEKKNITISPTHYPFSYRSMSALSHVDGFLLGRQGGRKGRKKKKIFRRSHVCNV